MPQGNRLLTFSCAAVTGPAFGFAALFGVAYALKGAFLPNHAQAGLTGGAGLGGMAIAICGVRRRANRRAQSSPGHRGCGPMPLMSSPAPLRARRVSMLRPAPRQ